MSDTSTLNLLILGIAIILVLIVYQNVSEEAPNYDQFVGRVPMVPIGNGMYNPYYPQGVYPTGQPMMYPMQMYTAKYPYINDTVNQMGRPCNSQTGCGVLGVCSNGVCNIKDQKDTVFDVKL
jgi:hypothetical protein